MFHILKKKKNMILIELIIIFIIISSYIFINSKYINYMPECYIKSHYNILCPSCGGTRCVISFLNGNFIKAFKYNIVFFITIIYLIVLNVVYIINSFKKKKILEMIYPKWWQVIIWVCILLIYTIIRNIF